MLTSANLSKQAWGDVVNKQGEVRIQSYETGVLVWPELFAEPGYEVSMVPTFGRDLPASEDVSEAKTSQLDETDAADIVANEEGSETEDENDDDAETEDGGELAQHSCQKNPGTNQRTGSAQDSNRERTVVGLRMPYDLPLHAYGAKELPWCASQQYTEPDWKGRAWEGFQPR